MSITKSQTEKIGSIFNGNRFIIPTYQRKYSWTDTERKALWQDIEESLNDKMNHFVGTLSFKENKSIGLSTDTVYEIIDGQQRITTIFILLKILIDKLQDENVRNSQLAAFIGSHHNLKLHPLGVDGDFLNQLLFEPETINGDAIDKRSQKYMFSAKKLFTAFSNSLTEAEIEERIIFIRDNIEVLVFNVDSQAQAVKMFSIINDRGLPLRILDKTKSILMLYSTLHLKEKLNDTINDSFEKIFDAYDELKETPDELKSFIEEYIEDFEKFAISYSNLIKDVAVKEIYQKTFRYLEFTATLYPLLVRLYMQNKLDDLLPILETIEVRVYKLRGTNPVADMYWLSSHISEYDLAVADIKTHLINFSEKFVNNHVFRTYLDGPIAGNGAVKHILSEYSNNNNDIETYKEYQVEHVFSRDPNYETTSYAFGDDYDYEKNRLGNLALLEKGLNIGVSNLPPINKVDGYLKSTNQEIRNLAGEIQRGHFDKSNVDDRRNKIIDFCISRFNLD